MIEATLRYLAAIPERPFFYGSEPPAGTPSQNTRGDRQTVVIRDAARELASEPSLDAEGFRLVPHFSLTTDTRISLVRR